VVLPTKEYQELLRGPGDLLTLADRKAEPGQPLDVVKIRLEAKWQNSKFK